MLIPVVGLYFISQKVEMKLFKYIYDLNLKSGPWDKKNSYYIETWIPKMVYQKGFTILRINYL